MPWFMINSSIVILVVISILHIYWGFGGRWGTNAVIPHKSTDNKPLFSPGKLGTLIVALLVLCVAAILFVQSKSGHLFGIRANAVTSVGSIFCAVVFLLRAIGDFKYVGFFKKVRGTAFAKNDTLFYSPLCLYLGIACILAFI